MSHGHDSSWTPLGDGSLTTQDADQGLGHIVPIAVFNKVFGTLLVLTAVTVAVAQYDFGSWNVIIAVLIASVKASLVATFFMHLKFEGKTVLMYAFYPLVILFLLIGGTVGDALDRQAVAPSNSSLLVAPPKITIPPLHSGESHGGESHGGSGHGEVSHEGHGAAH